VQRNRGAQPTGSPQKKLRHSIASRGNFLTEITHGSRVRAIPLHIAVRTSRFPKEDGMRCYLLVALSLLVAGCSDQGVASQDANAPVKIQMSQMYVTVRNDSGLPLNDVSVGIVPVGRSTVFNKFVGRLDNGQSRDVMLSEFVGRDGTPFSLRVVKPRSVVVKGKDVKGQDYNVEAAWR
jgi:hypothetical protein